MLRTTLLTLPPEIRHQIWSTFYGLHQPPRIIYRAPYGHSVSIICQLPTSLPSTCRSLYAEVWPVIWANLKLHLTRDHHNTEHTYLYKPLPSWIQDGIQHVSWYLAVDSGHICHSIPYQPLPLWLFPKLKSITICHAQSSAIKVLPNVGDGQNDRDECGLSSMVIAVQQAESHIGDPRERGRWIKAIVDPDGHHEESEKRSDPVVGLISDQAGEDRTQEDLEESEEREEKIKKLRDIARRVQVNIQLECVLLRKENDVSQPATDVPAVLVFDLRQRKIVEAREIGCDEYRSNIALGLSAHDADSLHPDMYRSRDRV